VDDLFRLGLNNAAWATGLAIVAAVGSRVWRSRPALAHALWLLVLLKLATPSVLKIAQPWSATTGASLQAVEQPSTTSQSCRH
jgi:beta-lactamase regulating signal transducer with metallopeptidase domain